MCAQHTHAVTGIGARVRVSIIAPVVRCLSFVIVRGPFVVTRENDSYTWVIRRGGRVTNVRAWDYVGHGYSVSRMGKRRVKTYRACVALEGRWNNARMEENRANRESRV